MSVPLLPFQFKFEDAGLVLRRPNDLVPRGQYIILKNFYPVKEGALRPRFGTTRVNANILSDLQLYSLGYLNDPVLGNTLLLAAAGIRLYRLDDSTVVDSGYSGNPLSMVAYRMNNSSSPFMIIGDSAQMRLISSAGVAKQLGITPPSVADLSYVLPQQDTETTIDDFDADTYTLGTGITSHSVAANFPNGVASVTGSALQVTTTLAGFPNATINNAAVVDLNEVGSLPAQDSDVITLWVNFDNLANLDYLNIQFFLGSTTTDYYGYLVLASAITLSSATSWYQLQIPRGNFIRTGTNATLTWADVTSYQFFIAALGNLTATFDDMVFARILGANSSVGVGYDWRYTEYDSTTGSEGNPSPLQGNAPPTGAGTYVVNQAVVLIPSQAVNARANYLRHYRRGGTLSSEWQFLGAQPVANPARIASIDLDGSGTATVTTVTPHGFTTASPVMLTNGNGIIGGLIIQGSTTTFIPTQSGGILYANGTEFAILPGALPPAPSIYAGTLTSYLYYSWSTELFYYNPTQIPTDPNDAFIGTVQTASGFPTMSVTVLFQSPGNIYGYYEAITVTGPTTFTVPQAGSAGPVAGPEGNAFQGFLDIYSDEDIASSLSLNLDNDVPVTTVSPTGITVYSQPLKRIWGPYLGSVIFGCGDPNRPGYLYWDNAGNPDAWSSINNVEVTQPSDPLQNGLWWGGLCYVFSKENLFAIYPAQLGIPNQYQPVPTACGRGLTYSDQCFAGGPDTPAIWGLGKDCIFETTGGISESITDDDLWPIFHQLAVGPYMPIDFTVPNLLRMAWFDGELYFSYQDTAGQIQVLAWTRNKRRWRQATYFYGPYCLFTQPEGIPSPAPGNESTKTGSILLFGGGNGFCYQVDPTIGGDDGRAIACQARTGAYDQGLALRPKEYVHFILDADPASAAITVSLLYNDESITTSPSCGPFTAAGTGRQPFPFPLGSQSNDFYALNAMIDIQVTTVALPILYGFEFDYRLDRLPMVYTEVPEDSLGIDGYKHVYDGYITVRSNGDVVVVLVADGVQVQPAITIPSTAGAKQKVLLQFQRNKFKLLRRLISGTLPFQFYAEDSVLRVGGWQDGSYRDVPIVENVE